MNAHATKKSAPANQAPQKQFWLMKSEPSEISIDDVLAMPGRKVAWFGVRNYMARNYMRDVMKLGDPVFFYHSSCAEPGIAGIAEVASKPYPDATQFDAASKYFDAAATPEKPRWMNVDVRAVRKTRLVSIAELRATEALDDLLILRKGNRLSITPVDADHWHFITQNLLKK